MIPRSSFPLSSVLPRDAVFSLPDVVDLDGECLGYFRDVWPIGLVSPAEATSLVIEERRLLRAVGQLACDPAEFDAIARAVETGEISEHVPRHQLVDLIPELALGEDDYEPPLECLELGVAGLVNALALIGAVPSASCRGHADPRAWSEAPVVFVSLDVPRAAWLQPLMKQAGCGFVIDSVRHQLIVLQAPSVTESNELGRLIVDAFSGHTELFARWPRYEGAGPGDHMGNDEDGVSAEVDPNQLPLWGNDNE